MFLINKYTNWYMSIISHAQACENLRITGYFEKHHIIPKSLGGSNQKSNLVKLTVKEHFVCHRLLTKMTTGVDKRKMLYAIYRTIHRSKTNLETFKFCSRTYSQIKLDVSKAISETHKNKPKSFAHATKLRAILAAKCNTPDQRERSRTRMSGRIVSNKERQKIATSVSNHVKQTIWLTNGTISKRVLKNEIEPLLAAGWTKGRIGGWSKTRL